MDRFEYEVFPVELNKSILGKVRMQTEDLKKEMNRLGMQGWELVSQVGFDRNGFTDRLLLLFKRTL